MLASQEETRKFAGDFRRAKKQKDEGQVKQLDFAKDYIFAVVKIKRGTDKECMFTRQVYFKFSLKYKGEEKKYLKRSKFRPTSEMLKKSEHNGRQIDFWKSGAWKKAEERAFEDQMDAEQYVDDCLEVVKNEMEEAKERFTNAKVNQEKIITY